MRWSRILTLFWPTDERQFQVAPKSVVGQTETWGHVWAWSVHPLIADMPGSRRQARFVPQADLNGTASFSTFRQTRLASACRAGHFARFHTKSRVTPAGVRGFVNFISSAEMDVMIRR
jgi:hypothetical protein